MFVNNRDQLSGFGQRLFDLMTEAGFNTPRALAVRLLEQGLVIVNTRAKDPYKSQQSAIGCVEKKINHHLHEQTAKRLQVEFVLAYCNVFNCTPDYLFGFINTRYHSKNIQNACECTGLASRPSIIWINAGIPVQHILVILFSRI